MDWVKFFSVWIRNWVHVSFALGFPKRFELGVHLLFHSIDMTKFRTWLWYHVKNHDSPQCYDIVHALLPASPKCLTSMERVLFHYKPLFPKLVDFHHPTESRLLFNPNFKIIIKCKNIWGFSYYYNFYFLICNLD